MRESVLQEAGRIVNGARSSAYGPPERNWAHIAAVWSVYLSARLGCEVSLNARDVSVLMILLKCMRECGVPKRDNLVDICGYAYGAELCSDRGGDCASGAGPGCCDVGPGPEPAIEVDIADEGSDLLTCEW